jgi:acetoacetyl-CoA synthetase
MSHTINSTDASDQPFWQPSPTNIASSNLMRFAQFANQHYGAPSIHADAQTAWAELWQWSINDRASFWNALRHFTGVIGEDHDGEPLKDGHLMPGARWFTGLRLNFAENLLARRDDHPAIIAANELGNQPAISYRQLHQQVARFSAGLAAAGVSAGDVVAGYMPNITGTIVAMLATTARGAIWTSCSPDFGIQGVLDRFGQVRPKILIATDGYRYAGKIIDCLPAIQGVVEALDCIQRVVIIPSLQEQPTIATIKHSTLLADFERDGELKFARQAFDAPLFIMYSSGTTGAPKCIVHSVGGTLLQHLKEHQLHVDLKPTDRIFYFTTCGWMMWNWLASSLATGATVVLYDGSPLHPGPDVLWTLAERTGISVFGTSPKYLSSLAKSGYEPRLKHQLPDLRLVLSTGSPLAAEQFDYVRDSIKPDIPLASISGGTDIISCFCLGNPWLPVYRGEIQAPGLGMALDVWNEKGESIANTRGELVCTRAFPSMPIGFWNDPDQKKYHAAYFERFNNVWHHGDYAVMTSHGGIVILGRSDAVLNPGGVRIGTAEIYRQVERLDEVLEALAIGQQWHGDERVILFVRLRPELALDATLIKRIKETIRANTTPRHVPAKIIAVPDIPRTLSGKIVELAVRHMVHGRSVDNTDALANPKALEYFRNLTELTTE